MLLPTSEEGSGATPSLSKSRPGPSALAYSVNEGLAHNPQAELAPHAASRTYEYTPHAGPAGYDLHRRSDYDTRHEGPISTTAVLAGVLGGFGGLCIVGCVVWVVRRKKINARREARRAARREREMVAKPQAERVSNTVEGSERTVRPDGDEGGLLKKQEQAETGDVSPAARETGASTRINVAARPGDGRPSSASKPADRPLKMSGSTDSLIRSAARGTTNPLAASSSPLARETPLSPSPQVLSREKNQAPRPRPPQEEASRPETPTLPVHPPLAFGTPVGAKTSTSSPTPRVRPQTRRDRAGTADGSASSDTEYFSDASHNAAPRRVQMVTNMGGIGGGQDIENVPRTDRSPRVQQTVVLDLPPAYSPD